jgi:hypothetical protein
MLMLRHLVSAEDGVYRPNPKETALLGFYANAIAHLLKDQGAGAAAGPATAAASSAPSLGQAALSSPVDAPRRPAR